ncbi:hypothetical protein F5B21DRAFT_33845 [Xylaria acuta]|nr:hypothetical protein F5B21DRAFT_33845 [Xylaria acuta]
MRVSMESLAAAVVQFVEFTKTLLLDTRDIYRSGKGATEDNLQLEQICEVLKRLSGELTAEEDARAAARESGYHLVATKDALGLKSLASSCKNDCDELLSIVQNLSVDSGANRHWRSIKASVRNFQHKGQIKGLEDRIMKAQHTMTLHVQSESSRSSRGNETFQLSQDEKLERITQDIHYLRIHEGYKAFYLTDVEETANRLSECLPLQDELAKFQRILYTLQFQTRSVRHNSISEAHVTTFKWIFESRFSKWLRDGDGIFWISGKAGSGKSTMMKFIADHEISHKIAYEWAAPKPVVIACHYFWNPGTEMQRSQQGLLQTLLFDIFRQCPTLVPQVCPKRWGVAHKVGLGFDAAWTIPELSACLQEVAGKIDSTVRFCLFIDGLDEFSGNYVDLCQALQSLSESRHIKLCVSSRPWNVFQDFFGQNPDTTFSIHELTQEDIHRFAQSRLEIHPRWKACRMSKKAQNQLIQEITNKAEGVFLWAFLVTQSLREGLSNDDTMTDLQRRLRSLPADLEQLFKNLLNRVDPVYHEHMARIIQIARCAKSPLNLCLYYHHEKQSESEDYAYSRVQRLKISEYFEALELTRRRINSKTRGLLEVVFLPNNKPLPSPLSVQSVQFLHRTVRDFLRTREMDDFLAEKSRENFDPALEICKASLAKIKCECRVHVRGPKDDLKGDIELYDMLRYATEVTAERADELVKILDGLESTIVELSSRGLADKVRVSRLAFRRLILRYNLFRYVSAKLSLNPIHFDVFGTSALSIVLQLDKSYCSHDPSLPSCSDGNCLPVDCIMALLKRGHDPNKLSSSNLSSTPWCELLHGHFVTLRNARLILASGLLQIFLRYGADPNGKMIRGDDSDIHLSAFALFLLTCFDASLIGYSTTTYLNVLQDFLDCGADLDYQLQGGSARRFFGLLIMKDLTRGSICEVFSLCLKSRAEQWVELDENDQKECHFLYSVTRKLLSLGMLRNYNMAMLIEAIPTVFPEGPAEELLAIALKAGGSRNRRKRDEEGGDPEVRGQKRQKGCRSGQALLS